jgi:hypothetical protein
MVSTPTGGHRFNVDDRVFYSASPVTPRSGQPPAEAFVIVATLPRDRAGTFQYRIRPKAVGPDRIATEGELRR